MAVAPTSLLEDAAGVLTYTFTRDNTSAETPALTVNFGTTGSATAGSDYTASAGGTVRLDPRRPQVLLMDTRKVGLKEKSEFIRGRLSALVA